MLFLTETFLSNYADDSNFSSIGKDFNLINEVLCKNFRAVNGLMIIKWF